MLKGKYSQDEKFGTTRMLQIILIKSVLSLLKPEISKSRGAQ